MCKTNHSRLLAIGPLPPPLAGTSVSFALFKEHLSSKSNNLQLTVIDSAPKEVGKRSLFSSDNLRTAVRIIAKFSRQVRQSDSIIIFGNDQFLLTLMPVCLLIAKINNKPCFIRCFGGSLDQYYANLPTPVRRYFKFVLSRCDGLIVQTKLLKTFFDQQLPVKVTHVPGYREPNQQNARSVTEQKTQRKTTKINSTNRFRLFYLGHIREEKGLSNM